MMRTLALMMLSLGACAAHESSDTLLGHDLDDVRSRYGPPVECSVGGGGWTLAYRDASGAVVGDAVAVVDDVVVSAASGLQRNEETAANRWIGVRVEEVVEALGPGSIEATGTSGVTIRFGDRILFVVDGRVAGES